MTPYAQIASNKWKTSMIFALFVAIFTGFFYLIGTFYEAPVAYAVLGFGISLFSTIGSYFYSDRIVLATTQARFVKKEEFFDFYTVTENLAIAAGIPMPRICVIDDASPNAFATGRDPKHGVVVATTGLLQMLERSEVEAVIAHELSHIRNYDILVMSITSVLVGTLALVSDIAMRSLWWGGGKRDRESSNNPFMLLILIVALILTPIIAMLIQLAVSRQREYLADASAVLVTRYPDALASALEKISSYPHGVRTATTSTAHMFIASPFRKGQVSGIVQELFSTHPSVAKRIEVLRKM